MIKSEQTFKLKTIFEKCMTQSVKSQLNDCTLSTLNVLDMLRTLKMMSVLNVLF